VTDPRETDEAPALEDDDEPLRWYVIAAFVVAVVAGFGLMALQTVAWYSKCDEGEHVQPYVAGDSLRGSLCGSGTLGAGLVVPGAWLVGLALATLALARWGGGRLRGMLLAALFAAPLVLPPVAYAGLQLSSTTCSSDKMKAYRSWVDEGSKGTPPYECRTF
jgi:hypothetical protein